MPRLRPSLVWSGLLLGVVACAGGERAPARRSVVLIVVDTLRRDHLSCYGYPRATSPNVDRLAAAGTRFDQAVSQAPWTTPSIGSLLTSRYPTEIGIRTERSALSDELSLLPELLRDAGWRTGAVVSHTFCSSQWNFDQGFESFDESNVLGHQAVTSPGVTARALEFVDAAAGEPFFLWAHYFDPHFAYVEHPEYPFGGRGDYDGPIASGMPFAELFPMRKDLGADDADEIRRLYDSEVAYTDRAIGDLLDGLRERGLFDDALIVFTADHGEEFFDHGGLGHARQVYQELVHVPLIVKLPSSFAAGASRAAAVETPVPLLDVFPTVLDVAGVAVPQGIEGRSLLAADGSWRPVARPFFSETSRAGGVRAIVDGGWKLIEKARDGTVELYRLAPDSRDAEDLAASEPQRAAELGAALQHWTAEVGERAPGSVELDLDAAELERLRSLGYAGADDGDS